MKALLERAADLLDGILAEEETHVGIIGQHNALLEGARDVLSADARALLEQLERLEPDDYLFPAELAVRQFVEMTARCADAEGYRATIESGANAET